MRSACSLMTLRKRSRASASSLAAALQRLDKAAQGGQRRAQLVAGVGDEIGAHAGEPVLLRQVAKGDQQRRIGAALSADRGVPASPATAAPPARADAARPRATAESRAPRRLPPAARDRGHRRDVPAAPAGAEQLLGRAIGVQDLPGAIERHRGFGHRVHHHAPRVDRWRRRFGRNQPCACFAVCRRRSAPPMPPR